MCMCWLTNKVIRIWAKVVVKSIFESCLCVVYAWVSPDKVSWCCFSALIHEVSEIIYWEAGQGLPNFIHFHIKRAHGLVKKCPNYIGAWNANPTLFYTTQQKLSFVVKSNFRELPELPKRWFSLNYLAITQELLHPILILKIPWHFYDLLIDATTAHTLSKEWIRILSKPLHFNFIISY